MNNEEPALHAWQIMKSYARLLGKHVDELTNEEIQRAFNAARMNKRRIHKEYNPASA